MTPSEAIRKAQEALTAPPMTTDEVKAHWSMVAVLRARSFGGWEAFMPEFFREAQRMLERQFDESLRQRPR